MKAVTIACAAVLAMFGGAAVRSPWSVALRAQAQAPLAIDVATPDPGAGTVTIAGRGFGARPFVTLDLVPLTLRLAMDQRIIAVVPIDMMPPGTYLLTVSRGAQAGDTASIEVRLGTASGASSAPAASRSDAGLPGGSDAAAKVGDRTITMAEVDREWQRTDPIGYLIASRQLYDARRRAMTSMINDELLSHEASSRGISVDALLKEELPKRTIALPDTAVTSLYQTLGSRTRGASLDQLRPALREWLKRKVEPELAKMTYIEELTKVSTRAEAFVRPPRVAVEHRPDDPAIGPADAPVEMVFFGDFQNPTYSRYALTLPRIRDQFGSRVRIVFKHLPADDPASIAAAEASACANLQGKFWEFHDTLLGRAGALDAARFRSVADEIGLDRAQFDRCVDQHATRDRIGEALEEAQRYALTGSPSLLVNGSLAPEPPAFLPPFEYLKRVVEEELQQQTLGAR